MGGCPRHHGTACHASVTKQSACVNLSLYTHRIEDKIKRTDNDFLGVMTMMDPVAIHLKDIDQREVKVIEEVVNAKILAEGTAIVVLCNCSLIGDGGDYLQRVTVAKKGC